MIFGLPKSPPFWGTIIRVNTEIIYTNLYVGPDASLLTHAKNEKNVS